MTWEEFNSTLEKIVDVVIEKCLAAGGVANVSSGVNISLATIEAHITTAVNKRIITISNSFEQLVFRIMTQLHFLRLPGTTPSYPAVFCREIRELNPTGFHCPLLAQRHNSLLITHVLPHELVLWGDHRILGVCGQNKNDQQQPYMPSRTQTAQHPEETLCNEHWWT